MLKAIVDTNVFVKGLLGSPVNSEIIQSLEDSEFDLIISSEIFDELLDVVTRPKFQKVFTLEAIHNLIEIIQTQAKFVTPSQKITICRDAEDQKILECSLEGADVIVTNDKDLLCLKTFRHIPIITSQEFLKKLK